MVNPLEEIFPGLAGSGYRVTSPRDNDYNCIAWAAGETHRFWWPGGTVEEYWPPAAPRERTVTAFQQAFATLGYQVCENGGVEPGFEKIALFADGQGRPTHAARQLPGGRWTSKLGKMEDIEHDLHDLAGTVYGSVILVMKRSMAERSGEESGEESA
jgi:hypothetical protein